jgi:Helix-hairpin-helix motif
MVPLMTFGVGTPFSFMYAALRSKSKTLGAAAAGYGAAWVSLGFISGTSWVLPWLMWLLLWIGGTVHAFAARREVYPRRTLDWYREQANERALAEAKSRQELRRRAREIAAQDPALAHELCIGRPDLTRTFDDGGLIDVNHAPAPTLALLPGLTEKTIEQIVAIRVEQGGFISAEELGVDTGMSPDLVQKIAEYAIFLP